MTPVLPSKIYEQNETPGNEAGQNGDKFVEQS